MNFDLRNKRASKEGAYVLLFGGMGYEREVSISGALRFLTEAEKINFDFLPIFINPKGDFYIFAGKAADIPKINGKAEKNLLVATEPVKIGAKTGFLKDGRLVPVKLVFPLLHGDYGEDGVVQGLLTALGMNFVGADHFTGALASDKVYSKIIARSCGVPTLPEIVLKEGEDVRNAIFKIEESFGFPAFVKPARLGSSIGASLVKSKQELSKSLKKAFSVSKRVMVEPAVLDKRELEVAYYDVGGRKIITPPAEVSVGGGFYDFDLKYKSSAEVTLFPRADVSDEICERVRSYSEILADAMSVRHIARFDFFLLPDGRVYFNEVNTMPGMTATSLYSEMLSRCGVGFSDFILSLGKIFD